MGARWSEPPAPGEAGGRPTRDEAASGRPAATGDSPVRGESAGNVVVAAVCQPWRQDLEFGLWILDRLREEGVHGVARLEDWSFGTIPAFQKLRAGRFERAVFLSAARRGRRPGTVHRFRPPDTLPGPREIRARIADGATGLVSVDNLLVMGRFYGALPPDVVLVEAEPVDDGWGRSLSTELAARLEDAVALVRREVARDGHAVDDPPGEQR